MAELTSQERLQPSLLDRLTDANPESGLESRDQRVLSWQRLRDVVRRDLGWLLNCTNVESVEDLSNYPYVARSTINYGIPDLAGKASASIDTEALQKRVRQAILDFEPRIVKQTLVVEVQARAEDMSRKCVAFVISGEMWAQPVPMGIYVRTELDLETGSVTLAEGRR
jgi:type VI secretion system protein ImpF